MTTLKLKINERSKIGKAVLEVIKMALQEDKAVEIIDKEPNAETLAAMEEVENGRTFKVENSKQLFEELDI